MRAHPEGEHPGRKGPAHRGEACTINRTRVTVAWGDQGAIAPAVRRLCSPIRVAAMMRGVDFDEFLQALLEAFDEPELERLVRVRLNEDLATIVGPGPMQSRIFELLKWAERKGTVAELARAAHQERSNNEKILRVYEKLGKTPTGAHLQAGAQIGRAHA